MVREPEAGMTDVVQRVHRSVWDGTIYAPDPDGQDVWGAVTWQDGKAVGDCEEWADRAMDGLLSAGIDREHIGVVLCHTNGEDGYNHAVCLVNVPELGLMTCGDAYDEAGPRPIRDTRYSFHSFMRLSEPGVWRKCPEGWPYD
jgi:predicted transglutaminase-like cysteine proteinase